MCRRLCHVPPDNEVPTQSVRNIWKIETDAKILRWNNGIERLTTNAGYDTDVTISRDGKKLAYAARTERTRL